MNNNEKLDLIERVDHASEDQAKRTLRSMILKCTVRQDTIARAIKDAIERHTPTPMIVYQQPESEDEDEATINSSRKKSKKKKDQDNGSQEEEGSPSTTSKKRRSTRRGDINADPLVGQLILRKTKTKTKHNSKRRNDHDKEQHNLKSLKKKKSEPPPEPRPENEQRVSGSSIGRSSKQKASTVIDLVSSSDDESDHTEQPGNEILDNNSFNGGSPDNDGSSSDSSDGSSSDTCSSDSSSSDDEGNGNESQDDGLSGEIPPSLESSSSRINRASEKSSGCSDGVARSITSSISMASTQSNGKELTPVISGKKRKAPECTVEEVQNNHLAKSTSNAPVSKKPKQNHPQEQQKSRNNRECWECGMLFPSLTQLVRHGVSCKFFTATLGSHHRPQLSSHDHSGRLQHVQKASQLAGSSSTGEPHDTLKLPSRPRQTIPADRGLLVPPPSFVHEPNNFPRGPTPTPLGLARSASGIQRSRLDLAHRPVQKLPPNGSPGHQSQLPKPESIPQSRTQWDEMNAILECKFCKELFTEFGNEAGACKGHRGQYQLLTEKHLIPKNFKGRAVPSQPYEAWTCCRRQGKDAPPCKTDGMHVRS